jgi:hypothetical protein
VVLPVLILPVCVRSSPTYEVGPSGVPPCFDCVYFVRDNVLYCDADSRFRVELHHLSLREVLSVLLLVDSGACFTCVNSVFVRRHNLKVTRVDRTPLYSACGRALRVEGYVTLDLCFAGFSGVRAYVLENLSEEVIVGRDFLARNDLCVHVDGQRVVNSVDECGECDVCRVCNMCSVNSRRQVGNQSSALRACARE